MPGRLKIFLGYAAGVGKTYQVLTEARAMKAAGVDVVIGYFEPHARVETIALCEGLEFVPRAVFEHRGARFEDMDTAGVMARRPTMAVVDEFAHTNAPGAPRSKRWQDVQMLLDSGIDVLTSLNVQHIESLNDQVREGTGVRVRETVPDWMVKEAAEVVMVDITPRALLHRMERGVIYAPDKAAQAVENFFTESNLTALRELALRQTAQLVEHEHPAEGVRERILLWLTPRPSTAMLIRRARRVADFLHADCTAIYEQKDFAETETYINFCRNLKMSTVCVDGTRGLDAVADYAREAGAAQLYVSRDTPGIEKLAALLSEIQITIVVRDLPRS